MSEWTVLSEKCADLELFGQHQKFRIPGSKIFLLCSLNKPVLLSHSVLQYRLLSSSDALQPLVFCTGVSICGFLAEKTVSWHVHFTWHGCVGAVFSNARRPFFDKNCTVSFYCARRRKQKEFSSNFSEFDNFCYMCTSWRVFPLNLPIGSSTERQKCEKFHRKEKTCISATLNHWETSLQQNFGVYVAFLQSCAFTLC